MKTRPGEVVTVNEFGFPLYVEPSPTEPQPWEGAHYRAGGIETIDFMRAKAPKEEYRGYLRLTAMKYLSRFGIKPGQDPVQEVLKAKWFLDKLLEDLKERP